MPVKKYVTFVRKKDQSWEIFTSHQYDDERPWEDLYDMGFPEGEVIPWMRYPVKIFGVSEGPAGVFKDKNGDPMVVFVEQSFLGVNINLLPNR